MPTIEVLPDAEQLLQQIADALLKSRKVVVITGAGISTNSGIPDFRSENGLYSLIQAQFDAANKLHALAAAEADDTPAGRDLFDVSIWSDPIRTSVFYTFASTLRQKSRDVEPTASHHFISHLRDRGKLVRCYTQNIDQIEEKVGLSTSLQQGPGSRGRFSRKSTGGFSNTSEPTDGKDNARRVDVNNGGVECVFLHGSLQSLRCFLCGQVCEWDEEGRHLETLSGRQPECPHCAGATAARQERGKRALGVGKLRPDIVLYGEEHPNAHLIDPLVKHDLGLYPDFMLILGTSLKVHGLKVIVREFAKAVHSKGGKVVFVNFTKAPESAWGDIIDYWI
ncbi:DHS-like NAD/FAD-binding domain-containing protein, partial [Plectosphaerella cucumerina]